MINLIPPQAKKAILTEYWVRVISVWFLLATCALVAGIILMIPAYVLITLQSAAVADSFVGASEKVNQYKEVSKELDLASQQAAAIVDISYYKPMSYYITLVNELENSNVTITQIGLDRTKDGFSPMRVSGKATTRQALASFRDELLKKPEVASVDLPISNLAKDKDISFSLLVSIKKP